MVWHNGAFRPHSQQTRNQSCFFGSLSLVTSNFRSKSLQSLAMAMENSFQNLSPVPSGYDEERSQASMELENSLSLHIAVPDIERRGRKRLFGAGGSSDEDDSSTLGPEASPGTPKRSRLLDSVLQTPPGTPVATPFTTPTRNKMGKDLSVSIDSKP